MATPCSVSGWLVGGEWRQFPLAPLMVRHHAWVERMGWHKISPLESVALIMSEIGEALNECWGPQPTAAFGSELADIVLRCMDLAQTHQVDLDAGVSAAVPDWRGDSLRDDVGSLFVAAAALANTTRYGQLDESFHTALALVVRLTRGVAARHQVELEAAVLGKMALNEARGARGRLI